MSSGPRDQSVKAAKLSVTGLLRFIWEGNKSHLGHQISLQRQQSHLTKQQKLSGLAAKAVLEWRAFERVTDDSER